MEPIKAFPQKKNVIGGIPIEKFLSESFFYENIEDELKNMITYDDLKNPIHEEKVNSNNIDGINSNN